MAGVSYVTACKAMQQLRRAGVLSVSADRRYLIAASRDTGDEVPAVVAPPAAGRSYLVPWRRAFEKATEDIMNGAFQPGAPLPSIKELGKRYGVSYRTLRKALESLTAAGAIQRLTRGGFAVPALSSSAWRPRIVCVAPSTDSHALAFGQNDQEVFRALEAQCEHARIKIDIRVAFFDSDRRYHRLREIATGRAFDAVDIDKFDSPSILGYMYFIPWIPSPTDTAAAAAIISLGKPLVVADETLRMTVPQSSAVRLVTCASSPDAARLVARHLHGLGHRKIAFFSTEHQYAWSQQRLCGLREVFTGAGVQGAVVPFLSESEPYPHRRALEKYDFGSLDAFYADWRTRLPEPVRIDIDHAIERLHVDAVKLGEQRIALAPMLEQAIGDSGITAWVMVHDVLASMAVAFLDARDIRTPADLSLISFDDSVEALRRNFSSYNFNAPAVATGILGFILGRKPYADPDFRVAGFIADRGSTGPARVQKRGNH